MKKDDLEKWDKEFVWHPFTQMKDFVNTQPVIIKAGKKNTLIDIYGKKYFDGISSLWVTVHGHNHKKLNRAIKKQLDKIAHSTLLGLSNEPSILLAKKLIEIAPHGLKKVFYSDSGSTSVEIALKIAFQYWQQKEGSETLKAEYKKKKKFITFKNAYHGDTLGSVSVGGIDLFHHVYKPLLFDAILADFENIESVIEENAAHAAAVIIEPLIQGAAGMLLQPKGFLKKLSDLCKKNNLLLICDEVATGFGRTGKMFACEHENVVPDILCAAKGITGGYLPLAVTLTTQEVYDAFYGNYTELKTFFHGHTYTGNPLACAAALANLEIFEKENTLKKMELPIASLKKALGELEKHSHVKEVRQVGFMVGIELIKDKAKNIPYEWDERMGIHVCLKMRDYGVLLRPLGNVIVLMPPLSSTKKELIHCIDSLKKTLDTL